MGPVSQFSCSQTAGVAIVLVRYRLVVAQHGSYRVSTAVVILDSYETYVNAQSIRFTCN